MLRVFQKSSTKEAEEVAKIPECARSEPAASGDAIS